MPRPFPAFFFQTDAGREPVREWLRDLPRRERKISGEDIMTVQFRWPLGMPLVDNLGAGIWEIRSKLPTRIARILFVSKTRSWFSSMASSKKPEKLHWKTERWL